jgi:broad specificity phosphatase PhoE
MLLVRHAESAWNELFSRSRIDPGIPDPDLTARGVRQAEATAEELRREGVRRLIVSPYRRALRTAAIIADALAVPIVAIEPLVRERCAFSCDRGSTPEILEREWPGLDFSGLEALWWGRPIESHQSLAARCAAFRAKMGAPSDLADLAVVTHWGFIRCLTGHELANGGSVRLS